MGIVMGCLVSQVSWAGPDKDNKDELWAELWPFALTNGFANGNGTQVPLLPSWSFGQSPLLLGTNLFKMPTNLIVPFFSGTNPEVANVTPRKFPAPGVYLSKPYSCIVVVPGQPGDESMVIRPQWTNSSMPMIEPKVEFVPWPD